MKNIRSLFGHLGHVFRYGDRINPVRDWFVLLSISGLILCASVGWNIWLFSRVTAGETIGVATSTPAETNVKLDDIQVLFDARSEERSRYVNTYRFVDPSL